MTTSTFTTANGQLVSFVKNSCGFKLAIEAISNPGVKVRTCWTSGTGRFTSNLDYHFNTTNILNQLGVSYEEGNDSPRGGKTGQFVTVKEGQNLSHIINQVK